MALSRNGEIFYKHIFPNIIYDKNLGQYRLNLTAYIPYRLNKRQTGVLERICIKNNIYMEKLPEKLSISEAETLFLKLKSLKEQLKRNNLSNKEKLTIEKDIYKIRTTIFEGHQYLIYKLIMDTYPDLESSQYKEDIIQSCYEYLLHAIDSYDIDKSNNQNFRWYLRVYTTKNIIRNIKKIINSGKNSDLKNIIDINYQEEEKTGSIPTQEELSILTDLSVQRIKELQTLELILNAESIEELIESEYQEIDSTFDLEEIVNRKLLQDQLILLIDTLPGERQKEVIKLYCGFGKNTSYRTQEIANILGMFRQMVDQHRDNAVESLSDPTRLKYIKKLYENYLNIQLPNIDEEQLIIDEETLAYEKLERTLFRSFPKDKLISMINEIDVKYQRVLLIHLDLTGEQYETFKDRVKASKVSVATYMQRKKDGLRILRRLFKERYINNNSNKDINTTLDYLMYNYLNKPKIKTRKKDGVN